MARSDSPKREEAALAPTLHSGEVATHVDVRPRPLGNLGFEERYQARGRIGEGGMGEVLLCWDERIGREVAMKVLLRDADHDQSGTARFVFEAHVQGQLEHPAVVPIYDVGQRPDGRAYFTMKRVRGMTLADVIAGLADGSPAAAAFTRNRLLTAFIQVCLAVDLANERGLIHCDLKPDNIMLGAYGEVYVLDWGIAYVRAGAQRAEDDATPPRAMGTPGYMAPEQARGERGSLDARTDVYQLGAILFEILTLEPLIPPGSVMEVLAATQRGVDARASRRAPERDVPPELEQICIRATALRAEDRFASARELCAEIEKYVNHDRDVELRRRMATQHAEIASQALERLDGGSESHVETRREGLREAGRALALDPGNTEAMRVLVQLLTQPPKEHPPELVKDIEADLHREERRGARRGRRANAAFAALVVAAVLLGLRSFLPIVVHVAAVAVAIVLAQVRARSVARRRLEIFVSLLVAVVALSGLFGPLILMPSLVAGVSVPFAYHAPRRQRAFVIIPLALAAIVAPMALQGLGVLAPWYLADGETVSILPHLISFPPNTTLPAMTLLTALAMIVLLVQVGGLSDSLRASRAQIVLQSWQLRQVLPDDSSVTERRRRP